MNTETVRACVTRKLGSNKGMPRLWLEGILPDRAGFAPGTHYRADINGQTVTLLKDPHGVRIVSSRNKGNATQPVIDLNSRELLAMFEGMEQVRVVFHEGSILISPLASEAKAQERRDRLVDRLAQDLPLRMGSLSHGGGILSHALHSGLRRAGIKTELVFANDIREDCLVHAAEHNDAWHPATRLLAMPMQELVQDDQVMCALPFVEVLEAGLPCSAASTAGRSRKLDQAIPEEDPDVGFLVIPFLQVIEWVQPAILILENVPPYRNTASMVLIRAQLTNMGYTLHEASVNGRDWNCLEARERMVLVATTKGIEFDLRQLTPPPRQPLRVGDVLDPIGPADPSWNAFSYLKAKESRDKEAGKGFMMQVVRPEDDKVPTIRKFYHKGGSTDPYLVHPSNPELMRKFTVAEHARMKSIPAHLAADTSQTFGHEILGQSINYSPFQGLGELLGAFLRGCLPCPVSL